MSMSLVLEAILPAIIYSRVLHRDSPNITHGIVSGDVDKSRLPTREDGGEWGQLSFQLFVMLCTASLPTREVNEQKILQACA